MRLATLNAQLSDMFVNFADIDEAKSLFEKVFWTSYGALGPNIKGELASEDALFCLAEHELPNSPLLDNLTERFDKHYFDLEDEGDLEASGRYFQKARLTASLAQAVKAKNNLDFAEAAYEALMACDDPNSQAHSLLS